MKWTLMTIYHREADIKWTLTRRQERNGAPMRAKKGEADDNKERGG
jgi:hypothetical protein